MKDAEYRVVIDEITGENIGVVKIDLAKWKGKHWIVDPDGDERKKYKFRRIDASKYDTVVAFETHPILEVRYKAYFHVFEDLDDLFGFVLLAVGVFAVACTYILSTVIIFSDLVPVLKNSLWYQGGYWLITAGTIIAGLGFIYAIASEHFLGLHYTRKDLKIEEWLKFKDKSQEDSSPDV